MLDLEIWRRYRGRIHLLVMCFKAVVNYQNTTCTFNVDKAGRSFQCVSSSGLSNHVKLFETGSSTETNSSRGLFLLL